MCGILLAATLTDLVPDVVRRCEPGLRARGPDHFGEVTVRCPDAPGSSPTAAALHLRLAASLLQLRGEQPSTSPLVDQQGNVLAFNGELFGGLDVPAASNDGKALLAALAAGGGGAPGGTAAGSQAPRAHGGAAAQAPPTAGRPPPALSGHGSGSEQPAASLPGLLSRLRGPWSLLFWEQQQQRLWFGRDLMGKRSLLLLDPRSTTGCAAQGQQPCLVMASVAPLQGQQQERERWLEVPPGIYSITAEALIQLLACTRGSRVTCAPSAQAGSAPATNCQAAAAATLQPAEDVDSTAAAHGGLQTPADLCALLSGLEHHPWQDAQLLQLQRYSREQAEDAQSDHGPAPQQQQLDCQSPAQAAPNDLAQAAQQLLQAMEAAVRVRCLTINTLQRQMQQQQQQHASADSPQAAAAPAAGAPAGLPPAPVLVLFSGGVDSTLIAALAHRALPPGAPIDLANVCFDGGRSADRAAARSAALELAAYAPGRAWRLIEVGSCLQEVDQLAGRIRPLLSPAATVMDWNIGAALWLAARARGRVLVPRQRTARHAQQQQDRAGWHLEPVGIAAAGPGSLSAHDGGTVCNNTEQQPQQPEREEPEWEQQQHPEQQPEQEQQQEQQHQPPPPQQQQQEQHYRSAARVVLLGHGADEQCGGYGRHRTKFREAGSQGVADELTLDTTRLWLRNLGRDDRLVADHGREGRHPFLDEDVMSCLLRLPLPCLVDFSRPPGAGDKLVLRHLLRHLGLPAAAGRAKRAIQFGSGIGQLSNKRVFGSNRRANRQQAGSVNVLGSVAGAQRGAPGGASE